jgi:hypothetical protein
LRKSAGCESKLPKQAVKASLKASLKSEFETSFENEFGKRAKIRN